MWNRFLPIPSSILCKRRLLRGENGVRLGSPPGCSLLHVLKMGKDFVVFDVNHFVLHFSDDMRVISLLLRRFERVNPFCMLVLGA